jgi:manganese/zinc/iron transport system permease protein
MSFDFWILLTGALVASSCALLGCFLILRKMAMIGDAISHAVLPGIVIAFLISGSRSSIPMLIGAALIGVFTTFLIEFISKKAKMQNDAAIGLVFTFLFAVGIILLTVFADKMDLDADCVLHGEILFVPLDVLSTGTFLDFIPRKVWILILVFMLVVVSLIVGYKGFVITTFDPFYAVSVGISAAVWHYFLMTLVSIVTVVSFESVGAILVVAFLVVPAATAYLLTDSLIKMLFISVLIGVLSAILGYVLASYLDSSIPGAMTTALGGLFMLAFLFAPHYGILLKGKTKLPFSK